MISLKGAIAGMVLMILLACVLPADADPVAGCGWYAVPGVCSGVWNCADPNQGANGAAVACASRADHVSHTVNIDCGGPALGSTECRIAGLVDCYDVFGVHRQIKCAS